MKGSSVVTAEDRQGVSHRIHSRSRSRTRSNASGPYRVLRPALTGG
jgi:hypothetical protein